MSPPKMMSSPRPCTTVCRLVSGGPTTELLLNTFHLTRPFSLVSLMSSTYICMGLQFILWYKGLPTFRDCGGWWPRRRAMGGKECPSPWAGPGRGTGTVSPLLRFWLPGEPGEDPRGGLSAAEAVGPLDDIALMASRLRRRAPGETAPARALATCGGVCTPFVCSGGCLKLPPTVLLSTPSIWLPLEAGFGSQFRSIDPNLRSFWSGSDPRRGAKESPIFRSYPSVVDGVLGDTACTGLSKEEPPTAAGPGDKFPPLRMGEPSPLAGERLPSRELEGVCLCALGLSVPQRPLTQGASSILLTGDWERYSRGSGTRAGGLALIGDGREFKLGLSGARPLGAWLKTTTHCPTWKTKNLCSVLIVHLTIKHFITSIWDAPRVL